MMRVRPLLVLAMYPQTKPQGADDAKALKDALNVFESRFVLQRVDNRTDKRDGIAHS